MDTVDGLFTALRIPEDCRRFESAITGLGFEANYQSSNQTRGGPVETTIFSNPGTILGHFVTHAPGFAYSTFGIHVGQLDRLTFYSPEQRQITGYFIDCRRDSPTLGLRLSFALDASVKRKLIIPCGVAHAFAQVAGVVTRNDLLLFADPSNTSWNLLNDDVVFPWTADGIEAAPSVDVNRVEVPLSAGTFFYQLQQEVLKGGPRSAPTSSEASELEPDGAPPFDIPREEDFRWDQQLPGCAFAPNSFNSVAERSWMIIASTPSCVMDFALWDLEPQVRYSFLYHDDQTVLHTFLDREGDSISVDLADLRSNSPTFRRRASCSFRCDPRLHLEIPAGVGYRYRGLGRYAVRVERKFLSDVSSAAALDTIAHRSNVSEAELESAIGVRPPDSAPSVSAQQAAALRLFHAIVDLQTHPINESR